MFFKTQFSMSELNSIIVIIIIINSQLNPEVSKPL